MAEHHGERYTPGLSDEEEIHLPSPTIAPATVGLGVTILTFGILFGLPLIVLGGALMILGLATWLINDAREFMRTGDHGGHGPH